MIELSGIELLGFAASALVVLSLSMKAMRPLRVVNAIGSVAFVGYGTALQAWPVVVTNAIIFVVNVQYLWQLAADEKAALERNRIQMIRAASNQGLIYDDQRRGAHHPSTVSPGREPHMSNEDIVNGDTGNDRSGGPISARVDRIRAWCRRRPARCSAIGFGLLVAGGLVFLNATGQRSVGIALLFALAAAVVGAIGLLLLNEPIAAYVASNPARGRNAGFLGLVMGAVVVAVAVWVASPALAVVGFVIILFALLALNAWLLAKSLFRHSLLLGLGQILLIAVPLLVWFGDGVDVWSIVAAGLWPLGLVLFKIGLPRWIDEQLDQRRRIVTVNGILAVVLGVGLLFTAAESFSEGELLFGLSLPVVGLSALGISGVRYNLNKFGAALAVVGGAGALLAGVLLTQRLIEVVLVTAVAALVIAAVGAWFVFRGEALIAILLLGFVVGWVLVDRQSVEAENPFPQADVQLLALGDSYISGEGAARFFPGTNVVGPNGNQCRRAPTAYPYLIAERLEAGLTFLACSGARTNALDNAGESAEFPAVAGAEDQLQRFLAVEQVGASDLDAVLVSIGGNDIGFGAIIQACLLPQSCAVPDRTGPWLDNVAETGPVLTETYRGLRAALGDDTPIIAMPYPIIVQPNDACNLAIDDDEVAFVETLTAAINDEIRQSAAEAGIRVFPGSSDAFDGRLLCDEDPATNFFHLGPTEGPIAETVLPSNWVHGTLHPRASGHALIADLLVSDPADGPVEGYLVSVLAAVANGEQANPTPTDTGPIESAPEPQYQVLPDAQWVRDRLFETAADLTLPVGLLLVGGLVLALGLVKTGKAGFLNPSNNPTVRAER